MSPLAPGTGLMSIADISSSFGASVPCFPCRSTRHRGVVMPRWWKCAPNMPAL